MELLEDCPETTEFTLLDFNINLCKWAYPTLPNNIRLHSFNILEDFAMHPEWADRFDLVHQRLMFFAFTPEQWPNVLQSYFRVTKPGGYIQLFEYNPDYANRSPWLEWATN